MSNEELRCDVAGGWGQVRGVGGATMRVWLAMWALSMLPRMAAAESAGSIPNMMIPEATPAHQILSLSIFVLMITGSIFVVVAGLLTVALVRFRSRNAGTTVEPPQIYGSTQVELAWTVVPVLIVAVLFLTTARIIFAIEDAPKPKNALDVTVVGHQFWWEFRYPGLGIVTANELHVPVSPVDHPEPTFLKLLSADVIHSFWVPRLAGKTDLIPNHENTMWIDPHKPGLYLGQCAQFCGAQHAMMLLRVYVDTPTEYAAWVKNQQKSAVQDPAVTAGRRVFETEACMNCHRIAGTAATGAFGPDLTHLMSRSTIAAGATTNTAEHLREWIKDPAHYKDGALMPAMQLSDPQLDQVTAYLATLK